MIALYRGHIIACLAIISGIIATTLMIMLISDAIAIDDRFWVIMLTGLAWQFPLILGPAAYIFWVPKWEREEKATGRFPGDKEKE